MFFWEPRPPSAFLDAVSQVGSGCGALASRPVRLVLLLMACLVAAACTAAVDGTPSAPTGVLLPPRPREVRLDGVDPCSLLTPEQRAGLGLTSEPSYSSSYVALFRGQVPTCTLHSSQPSSVILGIGTVTTVGIERWREPDLSTDLHATAIVGFPAVVAVPRQSKAYCGVEVDVATGQLLDVQVLDGGDAPPVPQGDLCIRAEQSAGEMVRTLLAR